MLEEYILEIQVRPYARLFHLEPYYTIKVVQFSRLFNIKFAICNKILEYKSNCFYIISRVKGKYFMLLISYLKIMTINMLAYFLSVSLTLTYKT